MKDLGNELIGKRRGDNDEFRSDEFWAVRNVSFELKRGECLGLIGRNGAGKTTLLRMLNGLIKPDSGRIEMKGRVGALIALGAGFNPVLTGRENIYVNASVLGLKRKEIDEKLEEIIEFSELNEFIDSPVQSYSSGMTVRLGFAVASIISVDILVIDEVLAVGDFKFRWKCLEKIKFLRNEGVSIVLVSHNSHDLMRTCDLGLLIDKGQLNYFGSIQKSLNIYEGLISEKSSCNKNTIDSDFFIEECSFINNNIFSYSEDKIRLCITLYAKEILLKGRLIIGLFHSEFGLLFNTSSYKDITWFTLNTGKSKVILELAGFRLQYGICYAEVSLRGENISDIYDSKKSINQLIIREPIPNYEGFGVNGGILPSCTWEFYNDT